MPGDVNMVADNADGSGARASTRNASIALCLAVGLAGGLIGGMIPGRPQPESDPATAADLETTRIDRPSIALLNERIDTLYARVDRQASFSAAAEPKTAAASESGDTSLLDDLFLRIQNLERRTTAAESSLATGIAQRRRLDDCCSKDEVRALIAAELRDYESVVGTIAKEAVDEATLAYWSSNRSSSDLVTYKRLVRELDTVKQEIENRIGDIIRNELGSSRRGARTTSSGDGATRAISRLQTDLSQLRQDLGSRLTNVEREIERLEREIR